VKADREFDRFYQKLRCVISHDVGLLNMLDYWIDNKPLKALHGVSQGLDDSMLSLAFEGIVRFRRESRYNDSYSGIEPEDFAHALGTVLPVVRSAEMTGIFSGASLMDVLLSMSAHVCSSNAWVSDADAIRGYVLMQKLGYRDIHLDGAFSHLQFIGQHFDLIVANWKMFEERGILDEGFIKEMKESQDGASALTGGLL
jgi:hypothetical protein